MKFLHAAAFAVVLTFTNVPVLCAQEPDQDKEKPKQQDEEKKKQPANKEKPQPKPDDRANPKPTKTNPRVRPSGATSRSGKRIARGRMTGQRRMRRSGTTQNETAATASRMNASVPALAPSIISTWRGAMTGTSNTAVMRSNM